MVSIVCVGAGVAENGWLMWRLAATYLSGFNGYEYTVSICYI